MKGIPYGWFTWAAVNSAASAGAPLGLHAAGLAVPGLAAVTLAADTRALVDLDAVYGPYTAFLGPVAVTGASYLGDGHSTIPAAFSVALAILARSAATRKGERK